MIVSTCIRTFESFSAIAHVCIEETLCIINNGDLLSLTFSGVLLRFINHVRPIIYTCADMFPLLTLDTRNKRVPVSNV